MCLHYFVKFKICDFVKILMLETETQLILLIDFAYWKRCNFLTLKSRYGKF